MTTHNRFVATIRRSLIRAALIALCFRATAASPPVVVSNLAVFVEAAQRDSQVITLTPCVYRLTDYVTPSSISERRQRKQWHLLTLGGNGNTFILEGVTLEVDTALRAALRPPVHTSDIVITGTSNFLRGLTITNVGNGTSPGGAALSITGAGNTLRECTVHVRGSFPYGYGDLFGKGGPDIISHHKKSGIHITGSGTRLIGCKLFMRSFGHGYFVQQDAANVSFQDCYVEGEMRATDEMLAERTGPAAKVGFRTVVKNRQGENKVVPGYMKSLAEDGFRTYGQHQNLSFSNCTAKNMRGGFELRTKTAVRLENCTAIGNERGFWISSGAVLTNCQGDAQFGPLLFVEGDKARAQVELLPAESTNIVHALATIHGAGHAVTLRSSSGGAREKPLPILLGFGTPMMGDGMAPIPERSAKSIRLINETRMPVVIGAMVRESSVVTRGPVPENQGKDIVVERR